MHLTKDRKCNYNDTNIHNIHNNVYEYKLLMYFIIIQFFN